MAFVASTDCSFSLVFYKVGLTQSYLFREEKNVHFLSCTMIDGQLVLPRLSDVANSFLTANPMEILRKNGHSHIS